MKISRFHALSASLLAMVLAQNVFAKDQEWPEVTEDGLHRVHDSKLALVYAEPGADLAFYQRVNLMEATVAFKKNWERDQRSGSASKLSTSSRVNTKKIKQQLAEEFTAVFTDKLQSGGYEVVDEIADDVLLIRPAIINLDVKAPETAGSGRTTNYVRSAGEMTLYVELYDSVTGDLLAKAMDRKGDRDNNNQIYTWANSHTNQQAAKRILDGWAQVLLDALNEARSHPIEVEQ
jgi:hypothetical protein